MAPVHRTVNGTVAFTTNKCDQFHTCETSMKLSSAAAAENWEQLANILANHFLIKLQHLASLAAAVKGTFRQFFDSRSAKLRYPPPIFPHFSTHGK